MYVRTSRVLLKPIFFKVEELRSESRCSYVGRENVGPEFESFFSTGRDVCGKLEAARASASELTASRIS